MRMFRLWCMVLSLVFAGASFASAHRVNIFAFVDGDAVQVECGFNRSQKVKQGTVEVFDATTGARLLQGTTDDNGVFRFPVTAELREAGHDLNLRIIAGEGHQNDWTVAADELASSGTPKTVAVAAAEVPATPASLVAGQTAPSAAAPVAAVSGGATPAEIERIVDAALDAKLSPIKRMLAEQTEAGPNLRDIIGGGVFQASALMFDEPFAHGRSLVHAVDPRFRLVAAFVCAVCLAVVRTPEAAWFGFGMAALLLALSRPPVRPVLRRLAVVNVFIAFLWLTVPLTSGGEAIAEWGPLEVSRAGVLLTLLVTVKSNAIVMTFLALVATMDSPTIGYALERLRFPSKLVFLFLFTYRYLHVIADEWHKLHVASRLRGFAPKTNMHTYRTFGNMLGMVFVHSFDRSVRVYEAMILRGFSGRFQSVTAFRATSRDAVFALAAFACMVCLVAFDLYLEFPRG